MPLLPAVLTLLLACSGGRHVREERVPVVVLAASSLTEAMGALEAGFEKEHANVDVQVSFAGSQVLRRQIEQGVTADVFASANEPHMEALVQAGLAGKPQTLASNELVVIVPTDDPAGVTSFDRLDRARRVVLGTENVPVGAYARQILAGADATVGDGFGARVLGNVVSEESNVRLVRTKVALGEADAAIVYRTDVDATVRVVPIPEALNQRARYPIALLRAAPHAHQAERFVEYATSAEGRAILGAHGFVTGP